MAALDVQRVRDITAHPPGLGFRKFKDAAFIVWGIVATIIGLGTLVSPVTFRLPGNLAKMVATVDEMSGGRVELGMGAGWHAEEHAAHGLPFPPLRERYDMLEEALAIVHGLWTEPDGWSFDGAHWQVRGAAFRGRPAREGRRHPPIILGGEGGPRFSRLVARYADEVNIVSATPQRVRRLRGRRAAAWSTPGACHAA